MYAYDDSVSFTFISMYYADDLKFFQYPLPPSISRKGDRKEEEIPVLSNQRQASHSRTRPPGCTSLTPSVAPSGQDLVPERAASDTALACGVGRLHGSRTHEPPQSLPCAQSLGLLVV